MVFGCGSRINCSKQTDLDTDAEFLLYIRIEVKGIVLGSWSRDDFLAVISRDDLDVNNLTQNNVTVHVCI